MQVERLEVGMDRMAHEVRAVMEVSLHEALERGDRCHCAAHVRGGERRMVGPHPLFLVVVRRGLREPLRVEGRGVEQTREARCTTTR